MWHELLASCSTQSLWFRFSYLFKQTTHEMATRYCFIDYDREMGIVAEVEEEGQRKLIGVGRLVADADHEAAEYAVIVVDRWHGHGLGGLLTDYCLEIASAGAFAAWSPRPRRTTPACSTCSAPRFPTRPDPLHRFRLRRNARSEARLRYHRALLRSALCRLPPQGGEQGGLITRLALNSGSLAL